MINLRCAIADTLPVTMIPPFGSRPNVASARSISLASQIDYAQVDTRPRSCGLDHCELSNAGRDGGIAKDSDARRLWRDLLRSSSHFPLMLYSKATNPVVLPPGRAKLLTKPAPTGSITLTKRIATLRATCWRAATLVLPEARRTSLDRHSEFDPFRSSIPSPWSPL